MGVPTLRPEKLATGDDGLKLIAGLLVHNMTLDELLLEHDAT